MIESGLPAAGTAPSGAHQQPWFFSVITDPAHERCVRKAADAEERSVYSDRAPQDWLDAPAPLGTDWHKPFPEAAPVLVVACAQEYGVPADGPHQGETFSPDDVPESVGIVSGSLIAARQDVGPAVVSVEPDGRPSGRRASSRPHTRPPWHPFGPQSSGFAKPLGPSTTLP